MGGGFLFWLKTAVPCSVLETFRFYSEGAGGQSKLGFIY